jgi:hypothetical protein
MFGSHLAGAPEAGPAKINHRHLRVPEASTIQQRLREIAAANFRVAEIGVE